MSLYKWIINTESCFLMVYEKTHQLASMWKNIWFICFLCIMPLKFKKLSHLIIGLSLKVKCKKLFEKCIGLLNNARSTICPTKWAAVVLVLVESSIHFFFHLKDRMRWFTPSNDIVSDLYAVYNAYDVFSRKTSHVVSVAVFIFLIIHWLRLLVGFKLYFGIC